MKKFFNQIITELNNRIGYDSYERKKVFKLQKFIKILKKEFFFKLNSRIFMQNTSIDNKENKT
jgi:hypothetical protein